MRIIMRRFFNKKSETSWNSFRSPWRFSTRPKWASSWGIWNYRI